MKAKFILTIIMTVFAVNLMAQLPLNWYVDTPDPGDVTITPNTENFTEGTKSCQLTLHTTNVPYFKSDNFPVNAGASYTYAVDVYDNDTRGRLKIYCDFYDGDGNAIYGEAPVYSEDLDAWQTITWTAVVPDGAVEGFVWIKFYDQDDFVDEAVALVDNALFIEQGGSNAVVNGGLEEWSMLEMTNAYAVSADAVDVRFNGAIDAISAADFTLSGTENISFSTAVIDGADATLVHLSGASASMMFDLTVDQLTMAETDQMLEFYAGIAPIAYTNEVNPDGTIQTAIPATFHAIVSANDEYNNLWVHDAAGAYNGIMVFSYSMVDEVAVGDEVIFTAALDVYYDLSELKSPIVIEVVSTGNPVYTPESIPGSTIDTLVASGTQAAEMWEGQLVTIHNAVVVEFNEDESFYICTSDEGETHFRIGDNVDYQLANVVLTMGEVYRITGVIDTYYDQYRINPRGTDDITLTTGIDIEQESNVNIYPVPANDNIHIALPEGVTTVEVHDLNGKIIFVCETNSQRNITLSVSDWCSGVYFLSAKANHRNHVSRFMVR